MCRDCKFLFEDSSVNYFECECENMTEEEIDKYFVEDGDGCPHYQEDYSPDPSLEEFEEKELNK